MTIQAPDRVVFDCNVYFQALTNPEGPAARLIGHAVSHRVALFVSEYVLSELVEVASRPHIVRKYKLSDEVVAKFIRKLRSKATFVMTVPHVFDLPRDPDDAHYIDLAVAADAKLVVSRDKDLLSLRDPETAEGKDFMSRFPTLEILTPPEALRRIEGAVQ